VSRGYLCEVDIATNTELACFATGVGTVPEGLAIDAGLGRIYVAFNGQNNVGVYSLTGTGLTSVAVGPGPMGVAVDQKTHTVFVTDNDGNTVSILQPRTGVTYAVSTATVGFQPTGVAVNPLNDNVLVANSATNTVTDINGYSYTIKATYNVPGTPEGIDIDTATNTAYVATMSGTLVPIALTTGTVGTPIPVGSGSFGVAFWLSPISSEPSLVYVSNSGSNTVTVVNAATNTVLESIFVP
jgi:DNA-binding beta-propeller fold protein YncE